MSAISIREVFTRLGFIVDDSNLKKYNNSIASVKDKILSIQGLMTGAVAYGFYNLMNSAIEYGEELRKSSQITGIAVDQLEKLRIGAGLAEMDVATLSASLNIFSSNLANAASGSKSDVELFKKLGIDPTKIKSVDEALGKVAEKISLMENGFKKTALARELFGRGGAELIPLLNNYKGMLGEYTDVINAFSMSGDRLKQFTDDSDDVGDRFQIIGTVIKKLKIEFAAGLYPVIQKLQKQFLQFLSTNKESIYRGIAIAVKGMTVVFESLGTAFESISKVSQRFYTDLKWIFQNSTKNKLAGFLALFISMRSIPPILTAIAYASKFMWGAIGGWAGLAAAAIFLVVDDVIAYLNGEGSIIGELKKWMKDPTFDNLPEKFKTMFNKIKDEAKGFKEWFQGTDFFKSVNDWWNEVTFENSPIEMQRKIDSQKMDDLIRFKEDVLMQNQFDSLGSGDLGNIVNTGNIPVPSSKTVEQNNSVNIDIKIDGSNPDMTPEKIGEEVKKGTQAALEKMLRETVDAFPSSEPRFA